MIEFTTSSGFTAQINDQAANDWRLFDAVSDAQSEDAGSRMLGVRQICLLLLGKPGYTALQKHLAAPDGSVPTEAMEREILEIFGAIGADAKN